VSQGLDTTSREGRAWIAALRAFRNEQKSERIHLRPAAARVRPAEGSRHARRGSIDPRDRRGIGRRLRDSEKASGG